MSAESFKIVVCVRWVPDFYQNPPELDTVKGQLKEETLHYVINDYDLLALEEAIRIREALSLPCEVTVISFGPEFVKEILRVCLAMGADKAIHVRQNDANGWEGLAVAALLAKAIEPVAYDLILCGQQSLVGMHSIVGAGVAHFLHLPLVMGIVKLEVSLVRRSLQATQKLEKGDRWVWECPLPAVCTVEKGMNVPRYIPIHRLLLHRRRPVADVDIDGQATIIEEVATRYGRLDLQKIAYPRIRPKKTAAPTVSLSSAERLKFLKSGGSQEEKKVERLKGSPNSIAQQVVQFLADKGFICDPF
jgi:electron transfer flavoprotein beta subunit